MAERGWIGPLLFEFKENGLFCILRVSMEGQAEKDDDDDDDEEGGESIFDHFVDQSCTGSGSDCYGG